MKRNAAKIAFVHVLRIKHLLILTCCELQLSPFFWSLYLVKSPKFKVSATFVTVAVLITVILVKLIIQLVFSISSSIQYRDKNCDCTDSFITRCQCGNCQLMWREEENICCQEVDAVKNKNLEAVTVEELQAEPGCIVQHPGFEAVCLNVWALQTAWLQYKQQYGSSAYEGPEHKKNRHIAYRQLVRWC